MVKWALVFVGVVLVKVAVDFLRSQRPGKGRLDRFDFKAAKTREATAR